MLATGVERRLSVAQLERATDIRCLICVPRVQHVELKFAHGLPNSKCEDHAVIAAV